ncbi:toll-like receptor 2 [Bacillus rossius redtenbacheri]|uniref:toll-like receptor 2 n=1 Tax=Bacillus rossius redtenbacheri TaxID=93214 RepID=UPI002FDDDDAD
MHAIIISPRFTVAELRRASFERVPGGRVGSGMSLLTRQWPPRCLQATTAVVLLACWATSLAQQQQQLECIDDGFSSRNTKELGRCHSGDGDDDDEASLRCDELLRAMDYAPFISFPFYVRARYELRVLGEPAVVVADEGGGGGGSVATACLGLDGISVRRMPLDGPWNLGNYTALEPFRVFMLIGATEMTMDTRYDSSVAVGLVRLDADCWRTNRSVAACAEKVLVAEQVLRPERDRNPYQPDYWDEVKEVNVDLLKERDGRLRLDLKREFDVSATNYLVPLVGTHQLVELRVSGMNLSATCEQLSNVSALRILELPGDDIEVFPPEIFHRLTHLEKLNLANNKLQNISEEISLLSNLISLDLSGNPLNTSNTSMDNLSKSLKSLSRLKWLFLSRIDFRSLNTLHPLLGNSGVKLLGLDLSYCGLTSISTEDAAEIFRAQTDLEILNLAGNNFLQLFHGRFSPLHKLKVLNLSSCGMKDCAELEFSPKNVITDLDMSHNNLNLSKRIISSGCVIKLDLSSSNIIQWSDPNMFVVKNNAPKCWSNGSANGGASTSVRNLDLSYNRISMLTLEMMESLQRLALVDLGGNPIDCKDCRFPDLQGWVWQTRRDGRPLLVSGGERRVYCSKQGNHSGAAATDVTEHAFNYTACDFKESVNYGLVLGIPLATVAVLVACVFVLMYVYRFELTYLMHLVKMKRRRSSLMSIMSQDFQYDAFVCYSGSDRAWVIGKLLPRLERHPTNYRLCLHERDFVLGSFITSNIVTSMQNSRFTIVVLSNGFVKSQWCRWELEMANHKLFEDDSDFLILLELERLDRGAVPRHLKYLMDTRTYLEWPADEPGEKEHEEVWQRLEAAMGRSLSSRQLSGTDRRPRGQLAVEG